MADYPINKGIGHSVEFKGLKAQYLFIFAGGLLVVFFLVVVLLVSGSPDENLPYTLMPPMRPTTAPMA